MSDSSAVSGTDFAQFSKALTAAIQESTPEVAAQLQQIRVNCFAAYGFDGTFERLNGKTASQIIAEYQSTTAHLITASEVDGVRYRLYDAPKESKGKGTGSGE